MTCKKKKERSRKAISKSLVGRAVVGGGVKRVIISKREREMGTWRGPCPSQCPVPWGGGHRAGLGNVRHEGGNKADYCPPERVLVLGQGGTRSQPLCVWIDGWLTGYCLDGCWSLNYAGWPACLPTEEACKGTGAGLGNAKHDTGTKPTTVPWREALCWTAGLEEPGSLDGGILDLLAWWRTRKQNKRLNALGSSQRASTCLTEWISLKNLNKQYVCRVWDLEITINIHPKTDCRVRAAVHIKSQSFPNVPHVSDDTDRDEFLLRGNTLSFWYCQNFSLECVSFFHWCWGLSPPIVTWKNLSQTHFPLPQWPSAVNPSGYQMNFFCIEMPC